MQKKSKTFNPSNRWTRSSSTNRLESADVAGTSGNVTSELTSTSNVVQKVKDTIAIEQLPPLPSPTSSEEAELSIQLDQKESSEKQGEFIIPYISSPLSPVGNIITPASPLHHASPITSPQHSLVSSPRTPSSPLSARSSVSTSSESDSDSDFEIMTTSALMPSHFHGLISEDSESWIKDVEHWMNFKKLDENGKLGLIPLLLKDGARYWFDNLNANTQKDTFDHVKENFREQYKRDEAIKWKDSASVWTVRQEQNQSAEAYISDIQKRAQKTNMTEEQIRFSIINGLKPEIRQAVLQHEIGSIADIRKWATISEASGVEVINTDVARAIQRLEEKFDKLQSAGATPGNGERGRSKSPRVSFREEHYPREPLSAQASEFTPGKPWRSDRSLSREKQGVRAWNRGGNGSGSGGWRGRSPGGNGGNYGSQNRGTTSEGYHSCFNCGKLWDRNHKFNCPAKNATCHLCRRVGHFRSVCRQARHTQA